VPGVAVDRAHQFADPDRIDYGGEVSRLDGRQRVLEVRRHVVLRAARRDRVAKDPACQGADPVRGLVPTACLDAPQGAEHFLRRNRRHRFAAQVRVQRALEPRAQDRDRFRRERFALEREPLLGHTFECLEERSAALLALRTRIDAVRQKLARFVTFLTRTLARRTACTPANAVWRREPWYR